MNARVQTNRTLEIAKYLILIIKQSLSTGISQMKVAPWSFGLGVGGWSIELTTPSPLKKISVTKQTRKPRNRFLIMYVHLYTWRILVKLTNWNNSESNSKCIWLYGHQKRSGSTAGFTGSRQSRSRPEREVKKNKPQSSEIKQRLTFVTESHGRENQISECKRALISSLVQY